MELTNYTNNLSETNTNPKKLVDAMEKEIIDCGKCRSELTDSENRYLFQRLLKLSVKSNETAQNIQLEIAKNKNKITTEL